MTIVAQIATDGEQAALDQVFDGFSEDILVLEHETDSSSTDTRMVEIRTSEEEVLPQFHQACVEHGITVDIRRIHQEPDQTGESTTTETGDSKTSDTERVD